MERKKLFTIGFCVLLVLTFTLGYYIGKNNEESLRELSEGSYGEFVVNAKGEEIYNKEALNKTINKDAEILFEIQCNKSNKIIVERSKSAEEEGAVGQKGADLQEKYKEYGYMLKDVNEKKVELIREPLKYKPNKYVLLSENNEIIIAKSNENGSVLSDDGEILSREGTGTKISSLRQKDISNIMKGNISMQFDSIEKLNDGIKDFDIKYEMPE